jgi:hypothetical protein
VGENKEGAGQDLISVLKRTMSAGLAVRPRKASLSEASYILSGSGQNLSQSRKPLIHSLEEYRKPPPQTQVK